MFQSHTRHRGVQNVPNQAHNEGYRVGEGQRQHVSPQLRTEELNPTQIRTVAERTKWGMLVFGRSLVTLLADRTAVVV